MRITLTMVAVNRRYHVALVDRLPAGFEIINPDLAVSESVPPAEVDTSRAKSVVVGSLVLSTRTCAMRAPRPSPPTCGMASTTTRYVARATTPGEYVVPPAKAEEMYSPEVFGRSGSETVIVE